MGKTTSATRVALAPAFVPCENNRNVTFWSERAWVRTPPESASTLTVNFCLSPITSCVIFFGADHGAFVLDGATAHHAAYRAQLVEWILDVCAGERYGPTTADVAIGYAF